MSDQRGTTATRWHAEAHEVLMELGLWPPRGEEVEQAARWLEMTGGNVWGAVQYMRRARRL